MALLTKVTDTDATDTPLQSHLAALNACDIARTWAGTKTARETWETCDCSDWLLWWAAHTNVNSKSDIVGCAAKIARTVAHLNKDPRVMAAIEAAETWVDNPNDKTAQSATESAQSAARAAESARAAAESARAAQSAAESARVAQSAARAAESARAAEESARAAQSAAESVRAARAAEESARAAQSARAAAESVRAAQAAAESVRAAQQSAAVEPAIDYCDLIRASLKQPWNET